MNQTIVDQKYHFISMFNPKTGAYVRTGIINEHGLDTGVDPSMASFPHLIDVGIMGHCMHGKILLCAKAVLGCYQSSLAVEETNLRLDDFLEIAIHFKVKVNQFSLARKAPTG